MGRFSAEVKAELLKAQPALVPVFVVLSGGGQRLSSFSVNQQGTGMISPRVLKGGWGPISYGVPTRAGGIDPVETSVRVANTDQVITRALEGATSDPRGALAFIRWVLRDQPFDGTNSTKIFNGVVDRWEYRSDASATLFLRTDDRALRSSIPLFPALGKDVFPQIPQTSVGLFPPIVYGEWNSGPITGVGALPVLCTAFAAGSKWEGVWSYGWGKSIDAVRVNGANPGAVWVYDKVIAGGRYYSKLRFTSSFPAAGDTVAVDAKGLTSAYDGTGTVLLNPVEILKHMIVHQVFNDWNGGPYLADSTAPINSASFGAARDHAQVRAEEAAQPRPDRNPPGGTTEKQTAQSLLEDFLASNDLIRLYWDNLGNLSAGVLGTLYPGQGTGAEEALIRKEDLRGWQQTQDPGDLVSRIRAEYLPDAVQGKLMNSFEVEDPSAPQVVAEQVSLDWTPGKLL